MNDSPVTTIEQVKELLKVDGKFQFSIPAKRGRYAWIEEVLRKFSYHRLKKKKERTAVRRYIQKIAGFSRAQLNRLIKKHKQCGKLVPDYSQNKRKGFRTKYDPRDIALLINTDVAHSHLSGEATKKILLREYRVFHRIEYKNISEISVSHIYNIRNTNRQYNSSNARYLHKTRAVQVNIGIRAKPRPQGKPGFLRVDTVHSGDLNGEKGVYHVNIVDEVTQFEMIATVPAISEYFLMPVIEELLSLYPFYVFEFHSDNGSEYVNHIVAKLLTKLYIRFTKSRARHSNDNALVESKNGSIVRKLYGRNHIPIRYANLINEFNRQWLNIYLNYHRPCGFAEEKADARGKIRKKYASWMTPYEKFRSLGNAEQYLKSGVTFELLDKIAYAMSDNQFAEAMNQAKTRLYESMKKL